MYLDSPPVTARRPAESSPRRAACVKPPRQSAGATVERPRAVTAAARRTRLADAIVSQWLPEPVPTHPPPPNPQRLGPPRDAGVAPDPLPAPAGATTASKLARSPAEPVPDPPVVGALGMRPA